MSKVDKKLLILVVVGCVVCGVKSQPASRNPAWDAEDAEWEQKQAAAAGADNNAANVGNQQDATTGAPVAAGESLQDFADSIGMKKFAFDRSEYGSLDDTQNVIDRSRLEALIPKCFHERLEDDQVQEAVRLLTELTEDIVESESDDELLEDQKADNEDDPDGLNECIICCSQMIKARTTTLEKCGHKFHRTCLNKWRKYRKGPGQAQSKCPLCRQTIDE